MWEQFPVFMSELVDDKNQPLIVDQHHVIWASAMQDYARLVLMAPRDHGKSWTAMAYLMWRMWRHNRTPEGAWNRENPAGMFQAVLFSDTGEQAREFFLRMQALVIANESLFEELLPRGGGGRNAIRTVWKGGHIRLQNRAEVSIRTFHTSTRGLHPQLIVCDDVLNEKNSATKYQRDKTWRYFVGTVLPMPGANGQLIVLGTAQHYDDLLHRLRPTVQHRTGFEWMKFRAVNWDTGKVLWPARHSLENLKHEQDVDAVLFSREYQNDPRDDASSMFPYELLLPAMNAGRQHHLLGIGDRLVKAPGTLHVLSSDMALSGETGADYCVIYVAALELATQKRTILAAVREKNWDFATQVNMLRSFTAAYDVDLGVIENNSFQRWVQAELRKFPETATKIVGHTTGIEKSRLQDGVPSLVIGLRNQLWVMPTGDERSSEFARIWASEMNAFGWVNDKLTGVGEHDDTVMAFWLLDRACRIVNTMLQKGPTEQYVSMEDVGLSRVKIGSDW